MNDALLQLERIFSKSDLKQTSFAFIKKFRSSVSFHANQVHFIIFEHISDNLIYLCVVFVRVDFSAIFYEKCSILQFLLHIFNLSKKKKNTCGMSWIMGLHFSRIIFIVFCFWTTENKKLLILGWTRRWSFDAYR